MGGVLATLALLSAASVQASERLVWLAPERAPSGRLEVGLTLVDDGGFARLPAEARISSATKVVEAGPAGPVRRLALEAKSGVVELSAAMPQGPSASCRIEAGAPAARVSLSAIPARPVKGRDGEVELVIAVLGGDGAPDPLAPTPIVRTNVGQILAPEPLGGGRFKARYLLPKERFPEVAIVVAFAPWPHALSSEGAFGALAIPLASAVVLPGRTEPGASISLEVAGSTFGPVVADEQGNFAIPIVVPPGHRMAKSLVTDRAGNRRAKPLDLHLPPTDRIACVANPPLLPADGASRARILCVATDPFGEPVERAKLTERAEAGKLDGPRAMPGGVYAWDYRAPGGPGGKAQDQIELAFPAGGAQSTERIAIDLARLPVARAELEVEPTPVFGGSSATVRVRSWDEHGSPTPARALLSARYGKLGALAEAGPGEYVGEYLAPVAVPDGWTESLSGVVLTGQASPPTRLRARLTSEGILASAEGLSGTPLEGVQLELAGARATTGPDGSALLPLPPSSEPVERLEIFAVERPSLRALLWRIAAPEGAFGYPAIEPPSRTQVSAQVALAPATPVDLRVELIDDASGPQRLRFEILDPHGRALRGRKASWSVTTSEGRAVGTGPEESEPGGAVVVRFEERVHGQGSASVVDLESGVSAVQEASFR